MPPVVTRQVTPLLRILSLTQRHALTSSTRLTALRSLILALILDTIFLSISFQFSSVLTPSLLILEINLSQRLKFISQKSIVKQL